MQGLRGGGGVTGEGREEFIVKSAKSAVGGSPLLLSPVDRSSY